MAALDTFVKYKRFLFYILLIYMLLLMKYEQYRKKTRKNEIIYSQIQYDSFNDSIEAINTKLINFEGFNNNQGLENQFIVPNIIHFVHLNQPYLKFASFLSVLSAWLNQKPTRIYFHCNDCGYKGKYWIEINKLKALRSIIIVNKLENLNERIFNLSPGWIHHKADTLRLLILMEYGGVYLDNDMLLIQSIDYYRRFEFALSWDSDADGIGNQLLIANKNARLLRAMYDGYREHYNATLWYYNGGYYPASILLKNRNLAHSVKIKFGTHLLVKELYYMYWPDWKKLIALHLLINHRSYMDPDSPIKEFDEVNVQDYKFTFGEIARDLLKRSGAFSVSF